MLTQRKFDARFEPCKEIDLILHNLFQTVWKIVFFPDGDRRTLKARVKKICAGSDGKMLVECEVWINEYEDIPYSFFKIHCYLSMGMGEVEF